MSSARDNWLANHSTWSPGSGRSLHDEAPDEYGTTMGPAHARSVLRVVTRTEMLGEIEVLT